MRTKLCARRWAGIGFGMLFVACGESRPLDCTIETEALSAPTDGSVTYEVTVSGKASVNSLTYLVDGGETELESPALPWSKKLDVDSGDTISISATGNAETGGSFTARFSFQSVNGGNPSITFATCSR